MNDSFGFDDVPISPTDEYCMYFVKEKGQWMTLRELNAPQRKKKSRKTWLPCEIKSVFSVWTVTFYMPDGSIEAYNIDVDKPSSVATFSHVNE